MDAKEKLITFFLEHNVLLSEEILNQLTVENINSLLLETDLQSLMVIPNTILDQKKTQQSPKDWILFDKEKVHMEKEKTQPPQTTPTPTISDGEPPQKENGIKVITTQEAAIKKRTTAHFVSYFMNRYKAIERILRQRLELSHVLSCNRAQEKKEKEPIACIGMVYDKQISKNKHIILTLEDPTGFIKCIIKQNHEMYQQAKEIVLDEIVGVVGKQAGDIVYVDNILWPDIPTTHELKKSPDEVYAVFMSDTEFGSKMFLDEPFQRFLAWINGEIGTEEGKEQVKKIKYLFLVGDLVNGVGIYPTQEKDLRIADVYKQYEEMATHIKRIPTPISIIACPGNHDATPLPEPQPPIPEDIAKPILTLPNLTLLSNPSLVNIHSSSTFPGFDVLMYHGFSFIHYANDIESIRTAGGQNRPDLIMKFLLKRRHLAPAYASSQFLPETKTDPLVIEKIPDFLISGHLHQVAVSQYRNITMMNCSAWISKTDFQEKMGIEPKPGRVIFTNLQTRENKVLNFCRDDQ